MNVLVIVGGTTITPGYAGRVPGGSGYEQINFVLPANVQTGCTVPFQISENGTLSQPTFISIATPGAAACVQPGYTTSQLQAFDNGATVNAGGFTITQGSDTVPGAGTFVGGSAQGGFLQFTGFELAAAPAPSGTTTLPTGCSVIQFPAPATAATATGAGVNLDAGALTLTGPAGSNLNNTPFPESSNVYSLTIDGTTAGVVNGNVVAGKYTLNGAGGAGVGPFNATFTLGPPLTVSGGLPSTVNRSAGLTLNWTGGNPSDLVVVFGSSANVVNGVSTGAEFICYTTAGAQTLTVSSSILGQLPAITAAEITNGTALGFLEISSSVNATAGDGLFNAPLTAGGTIMNATFSGTYTIANGPAYQ